MKDLNNFLELDQLELKTINGGGMIFGFLLAAYIDFEIGVAKGIVKKVIAGYDSI